MSMGKTFTRFITKPVTAKPRISLLFQYKMSSYLGDYGAGRTIKTFSLLPGERTTISIRDFTHKSETKSRAESVLDSFSEHTVNELQSYIEEKNQRNFQIASVSLLRTMLCSARGPLLERDSSIC